MGGKSRACLTKKTFWADNAGEPVVLNGGTGYGPVQHKGDWSMGTMHKCSFAQFYSPCNPADYIEAMNVKPGDVVLLAIRVSWWVQEKNNNMNDSEKRIRKSVRRSGGKVVYVHRYVGAPAGTYWIEPAFKEAEKYDNPIVLVEDPSRFARHPHFHSKRCPNLQATGGQFIVLLNSCNGRARLMSVADPGSLKAARKERSDRGQEAKGDAGGRPIEDPVKFKLAWAPLAKTLNRKGWSTRNIAKEVSRKGHKPISHVSISKWLKAPVNPL